MPFLPIFILLCLFAFHAAPGAPPHASEPSAPSEPRPRSAGEHPLSLEEVLREVRERNPSLLAARARAAARRERVPQERAWDDPAVVYEGSLAGESDHSVKLEQTLPLSGRNRSRARMAQAEAGRVLEEARKAELEAVRDARSAYFQYAATQALIDLNASNETTLRAITDTARSRFEVGKQTQGELLTTENELARNAEARIDLERELSEAQSALNRLMHRPATASLPPPPALETAASAALARKFAPPAVQARALQANPEVAMARAEVGRAQAAVQLAHRQRIPDPTAAIKGRRFTEQGERMSEAMLEVSVPLPWVNSRRYSAGIREAEAELAAARADLEAARDMTRARVRDGLRKVETFRHHLELWRDKIVPLSRETLHSARLGYESDKATLIDVLDAQRRVRDDEAEAIRHLLAFQTALAELDAISPSGSGSGRTSTLLSKPHSTYRK